MTIITRSGLVRKRYDYEMSIKSRAQNGDGLAVEVDRDDGSVCQISVDGHGLLSGGVAVSVTDVATGQTFSLTQTPESFEERTEPAGTTIEYEQPVPGSGLRVGTVLRCSEDLVWTLELLNRSFDRREVTVTFEFSGLAEQCEAFVPSSAPHPRWGDWPQRYGYRCNENSFRHNVVDPDIAMVIPSLTLYRRPSNGDHGLGVTIMSTLDSPIQPFGVLLNKEHPGPRVSRQHLRIEPRASTRTSLRLGFHEPHWRPGLAYIVSKYPQFFEPDPDIAPLSGGFVLSLPAPDDAIAYWKSRGVRWAEIWMHPFHGKYDHDVESWVPQTDDQWHFDKANPGAPPDDCPLAEAIAYVESLHPKRMTRQKVSNFIDRLHAHGIKAFLYFMPTEVFSLHAFESFPQDVILDAAGQTVRNWKELIIVNPDPDRAWGQHALRMLELMLDLYPQADGIFLDEAFIDRLDYAHDDGVSIVHGRPVARMGVAVGRFVEKALAILRRRGKGCIWNGPFHIEQGRLADGVLSENGETHIGFLALRDKLFNGGNMPGQQGQQLLYGCQYWVYVSSDYLTGPDFSGMTPPEETDPPEPYQPLFDEVRRRTWVLTAEPVTVPESIQYNMFRTLQGNHAVVMFSGWARHEGDFRVDVPVSIALTALDDAERLRAVYLLSADEPGWYKLDWAQNGDAIQVTVPRHRRTSMLLLVTTGVFASVPQAMIDGHDCRLLLENWTDQSQQVTLRVGADVTDHDLPAGASTQYPLEISPQQTVLIETVADGHVRRFGQSRVSRPAIEISRIGCLNGVVGQVRQITFTLFNHEAQPRRLDLSGDGPGLTVEGLPQSVELPAHGRQAVTVQVALAAPGVTELHVVAQAKGVRAEVIVPVAVAATDFFEGLPVTVGAIEYDLFSPEGEPVPGKPADEAKIFRRFVYLNGQQIGNIVSKNMSRWFEFASLAIPKPVLMTLGHEVTLEIHAADPTDFFMIRNVRILLDATDPDEFHSFQYRTDAPRIASNRIEETFSTCEHVHTQGSVGSPINLSLALPTYND